jgi:CubicO group peptidase (beta-lactamase class C family)
MTVSELKPESTPQPDAPPESLPDFGGAEFFNSRDDRDNAEEVDKLLDGRIKRDKPGAAVLVIRDDQIVYEGYKGMANMEEGIPIGPDTIFDLASVSKQFTAMAVMILKERGLIDFDQRVSAYYPDEDWSERARQITVRHLLNHNSGLPDYDDLFYKSDQQDLDRVFGRSGVRIDPLHARSAKAYRREGVIEPNSEHVRKLAACWKGKYRFEPGESSGWEYSNTAYATLACLIEKASGLSFPRFMEENIFRPLGMGSTYVFSKTEDGREPAPREGHASSYDRGWEEHHEIDYTSFNYIYGDGNVHTTVRDMAKWDRAIHVIFKSEDYRGERPLIRESTVNEAFRARVQTTRHRNIKYSFGWYWGRARGKNLMWHTGAWAGFRTAIMRFFTTSPRFTVIVCSNDAFLPVSYLACRIARIYLEELRFEPVELGVEKLRRYVSNYQEESAALLAKGTERDDITLEGDTLYVKSWDLEKYKLVPVRPTGERDVAFYIKGAEDFDLFRYDISHDNINPPVRSRRPVRKRQLAR